MNSINKAQNVCFAFGCKSLLQGEKAGIGKRFHTFPNDVELAKKWLTLVNRMDLIPQVEKVIKAGKRLCEDHFSPTDYRQSTKGILKKDALPSLIPVHETFGYYEHPEQHLDVEQVLLSKIDVCITNSVFFQQEYEQKVDERPVKYIRVKRNPLLHVKIETDEDQDVEGSVNAHVIPIKRTNLTPIDVINPSQTKNIKYTFTNKPIVPKAGATFKAVQIDRRQVAVNDGANQQQNQQQFRQIVTPKKPTIFIDNNSIKLKPTTAIKLDPKRCIQLPFVAANGTTINSNFGQRPTLFVKRKINKTIRNVTIELIEKSPKLHLGLTKDRLEILKTIVCFKAKISLVDLYITLKKLRTNEDFELLGEYFEYSEEEVEKIFSRTILKLAKYLKFLIKWPEGKKYYDRHKNLPISFRSKLSYVQSLIECVETEVRQPLHATIDMIECKKFKFILSITPAGIISYVSEAYVGSNDDLTIFKACNFKSIIPNYLSLVVDPGDNYSLSKRETADSDISTDSADEGTETKLNIKPTSASSSQPKPGKSNDFSIPTLRVREPVCRLQIREIISCLREFKILQPYSILEQKIFQHINEILVIVSALTNLQR